MTRRQTLVMVAALAALFGCRYSASFNDCAITCSGPSDCPSGFTCGGEGRCRSMSGGNASCAEVLDGNDQIDASPITDIIIPSNIGEQCVDQATDDLVVTTTRTLDTAAACSTIVTQPSGVREICVLRFRTIRIGPGATLAVSGTRALALVATGDMTIDGTLDASGHADRGGPGAFSSGPGVGGEYTSTSQADGGAGGGGHATPGTRGGNWCTQVGGNPGKLGGTAVGTESLVPLTAGSRGGREFSAGGAGGGAVQLVACGHLAIGGTGVIAANGAGGGGGQCAVNAQGDDVAGGGGGAGGGILIEVGSFRAATGAAIVANGGGGGAGFDLECPSQCTCDDGAPGKDGLVSTTAATGGAGKCFGGNGGADQVAPTTPAGVTGNDCCAGNGAGSVGRIRVNLLPGAGFPTSGILVSPPASLGTLAKHEGLQLDLARRLAR